MNGYILVFSSLFHPSAWVSAGVPWMANEKLHDRRFLICERSKWRSLVSILIFSSLKSDFLWWPYNLQFLLWIIFESLFHDWLGYRVLAESDHESYRQIQIQISQLVNFCKCQYGMLHRWLVTSELFVRPSNLRLVPAFQDHLGNVYVRFKRMYCSLDIIIDGNIRAFSELSNFESIWDISNFSLEYCDCDSKALKLFYILYKWKVVILWTFWKSMIT